MTENIRPILNKCYWSRDVYQTVYFNDFVFHGLKSKILSKIIVNEMSGSSWRFRRFKILSLTVVDLDTEIVKWCVMAIFIDFEVGVESPTNDPDNGASEYSDSLESFIDDDDEGDAWLSRSFYHNFKNVSVDETLEEEYKRSLIDIGNLECSNFCETFKEEGEINEFKDVEKRVEKYKETLLPLPSENENENLQCHKINGVLAVYGYLLRVFEQKGKFCHLIIKNPKKQNIARQLSSCITEKHNGFPVTATE